MKPASTKQWCDGAHFHSNDNEPVKGFTKRYNFTWLVHYEETLDAVAAIEREKQVKGWRPSKKVAPIESMNSKWKDLSLEWYGDVEEAL